MYSIITPQGGRINATLRQCLEWQLKNEASPTYRAGEVSIEYVFHDGAAVCIDLDNMDMGPADARALPALERQAELAFGRAFNLAFPERVSALAREADQHGDNLTSAQAFNLRHHPHSAYAALIVWRAVTDADAQEPRSIASRSQQP